MSIPTDITPLEYARQCVAAAEASRLNPYNLHPEELRLLQSHLSPQQTTTYLNIRNGILRLWTRNCLIRVTREEAIGCAKDVRWFDVANFSYEWLLRTGHINYGCLEHGTSTTQTIKRPRGTRKRRTVVVIGAGISGLGCARQFEGIIAQLSDQIAQQGEDPPRVIVLEGRNRIGGRVYSRAFKSRPHHPTLGYGNRHTAEMGGMIITGFDRGNPMNTIVRGQLALPYHALQSDTTIYDATGRPVDDNRDHHAEELFNYILDRVSEYKFKIPQPATFAGDRAMIDSGKDPYNEGSRTIQEVEDGKQRTSQSPSKASRTPEVQMVPVSSDRLTGRSHLELGIPAAHTAAYKANQIGWLLRPGVDIARDLDLSDAVNSKYATLGSVFDEAIKQFEMIVDFTPLDLRLINWHVANLEYSNATTCSSLSLGGWDLDAGNEWEGKHTMVVGGYQQVPRGLMNCPTPLDVRKGNAVKRITYRAEGETRQSQVECDDGTVIDADHIVLSVPLGVLKHNDIVFDPPLPEWKTGAISRLGFGTLNKVVLVFTDIFWDQSRDIFGALRNPANRFSLNQRDYFSQRGRFFQWFNCTKTSGLPTLLALMAGDAAFQTEQASNDDLVNEAMMVLRSIFGQAIPHPIEAVVTRWRSDKFARGSYSYTGPNFQRDDYDVMAKPIGSLHFAGEHTCGTHPATVHGAYISGLRVASEVAESILGAIAIPEPLVLPRDSALKRRADAHQVQLDPKQARIQAHEDNLWAAMYATLGERPAKPPHNHSNPYQIYRKDKWDEAKRNCEEGRRPGKGKPVPNELKKMVAKMWRETPEEEKAPYISRAAEEKKVYVKAAEDFAAKVSAWDEAALSFRNDYEKEHPPPVDPASPGVGRGRRVRRSGAYVEEASPSHDGHAT